MIPIYFLMLSFALFSTGVAGMATSRHLAIIIMCVEIVLVSASLAATTFFYFTATGAILPLLFTIWSVAAAEAMLLIVFYRLMTRNEVSLDVKKLSELKD